MTRPPVPLHPRKGFTPKQRAEVLLAGGGRCSLCKAKIMPGEAWDVEHRVALALGGTNDPANLEPAHSACHRKKSAVDVAAVAKCKRLSGEVGSDRKKQPIPSRGFAKDGPKRKIPSRPFAKRRPPCSAAD